MQSLKHISTLIVLAVTLGVGGPAANAATMLYADVERLTEVSDVVVIGQIVASEVYVGNENRITTRWTVAVEQTLAGPHNDIVQFTQWAGSLDGSTQHVPGDAVIEEGARVVLFLHGDAPTELSLSALGQAKWSIVPTPSSIQLPTTPLLRARVATGSFSLADVGLSIAGAQIRVPVLWVERDLDGIELYDSETRTVREADGPHAIPLAELVYRVRAAAAEEAE